MCNKDVIRFVKENIKKGDVYGKRVLDVGSYDDNGSVSPYIKKLKPKEYIGVDIIEGKNVDLVCAAEDLLDRFEENTFDLIVSTEMLEHVHDWIKVINTFKKLVKKGGAIVITMRSKGFHYHPTPFDNWRFEADDLKKIFVEFKMISLVNDSVSPGVFMKAVKKNNKLANINKYKLYSIVVDSKILGRELTEGKIWKKFKKEKGFLKLNIGCGSQILSGYINVDKFPQNPEALKMDVGKLNFKNNFADGLLASHVLEHISFKKTLATVKEWHRVLKPGGVCVVEVPDFEWAMKKWLAAPEPEKWTEVKYGATHRYTGWVTTLWGNQEDEGQFHCCPFSKTRLEYLFKKAGFDIKGGVQEYFSHGAKALLILGIKKSKK